MSGKDALLEGLRGRFVNSPVTVTTIKPGFVDTPMTSDHDKGPLWATPEQVAADIDNAINKPIEILQDMTGFGGTRFS